VGGSLSKAKHETLPEKQLKQKKKSRGYWLKCGRGHLHSKHEALSSNPSTAKKKKKKKKRKKEREGPFTIISIFHVEMRRECGQQRYKYNSDTISKNLTTLETC
jgi:endonuclease I